MPNFNRILVAFLALLFVGGAVGVAAARPHGDDAAAEDATDSHSTFRVNGTDVLGRHVTLTVNAAIGGVTDFASRGAFDDIVIFSSIRSTPHHAANTTWRAHGDQFQLVDPGFAWHSLDHADAQWQLRAHVNETIRLVLAPGIDATLLENGTLVKLTHDGHSAYLRVTGPDAELMLNGSAITAKLPAGTALHFRIGHAPHTDNDDDKDEREDAQARAHADKIPDRIEKLREQLRSWERRH